MRAVTASRQASAAAILGLLAVLATAGSGPAQAAEPAALVGSVKDAVGNVLPGVEVLLVRPTAPTEPVAIAKSDVHGRFTFGGLLPGLYKVAAVKSGYRTFVGRVDTFVSGKLDLVLHPTRDVDRSEIPQRSSWELRLPRRSIFRETRPGVGDDPLDDSLAELGEQLARAVRMQFDQMFTAGIGGDQPQPETADVAATETRMVLASALGERGNLLVRGSRQHYGTPDAGDLPGPTASQAASSMTMDLSYATGPDAELAIRAFYDEADYRLSPESAPDAIRQEQTSWGYDASWSMQLDPASRVAVQLDYHDLRVGDPGDAVIGGPVSEPSISNRAVAAQGSYEAVRADRHEVQVAIRAQLLQPATAAFSTTLPSGPGEVVGSSGWSVQADAQDTYTVSAPFSIVYGLGYKHALVARDATLVVPRLGGSWSVGGWMLSGLVSYHAVRDSSDTSERPDAVPFRPEENLGYQAQLEMPLTRGVHLAGGASYEPIRFDYLGYASGTSTGRPLYLTDGNAAVREHRLAVFEDRGGAQTYFELSNGSARGTLAALLPFDAATRLAADRDLRYRSGRFGVRVPGRGTHLVLEYQKVVADSERELQGRDSIQEMIEVRLRQDMWSMVSAGDWRLLMAVRMGSVESDSLEELTFEGGRQTLNALNTRVSAGVSVVF